MAAFLSINELELEEGFYTLTNPVLNLGAKFVDKDGYLLDPWNSFFQQFTQKAPKVEVVTVKASPFSYKANSGGSVAVAGGTVSAIALIRGLVTIDVTGQKLIPIRIGDIVRVTYSSLPTIKFLGD